ncbi:MAG: HAD family phosphatase [Bryobacteraceae bacterium]|jgi:beta-phosphoglucomutase family hydrolase
MSNIRALIFDMDGVIVDSNPWHRTAWEEYNRSLGVEMTEEMQQRMYGKRNDELIREFFGRHLDDAEVFAHGAAKETLYREMMKPHLNGALVPGIREFLARHRGLALAVATNAEPPNVDFVLDETGLRSFFRVVVNGHEVANPKPHPEIYLRVADALGVAPADCVVFEDSHTGVEAALAAGMQVVGISTTHDDLAGVALLIRDFNDPALETWLTGPPAAVLH